MAVPFPSLDNMLALIANVSENTNELLATK